MHLVTGSLTLLTSPTLGHSVLLRLLHAIGAMGQVDLQHDFGQKKKKMRGYIPTGPGDGTVVFLSQMFKHLTPEGKQNLADDVLGCISNEQLYQLAVRID